MKNSSMLRAATLALVAAGALCTAGCLKYEQKTVIQKDGSGTLHQSISIDLDALARLREFAKAFSPGGPGGEPATDGKDAAPEFDDSRLPYNLADIQESAKKVPGVQIKNAKVEHRYIMDFDAVFASWSTLGKANLFPGSAELVKNADGTYTFTLDMMAGQGGQMGGGAPAPDAGGMGMDPSMVMALLEPMVGSLAFNQVLTLPAAIVETNGTKSEDGLTVSWKVSFKDLTAGKGANLMKVTFKGDGLDLKPFKYAPDLQEILERVQGKRAKSAPVVTPSAGGTPPAMEGPAMEPAMDTAK